MPQVFKLHQSIVLCKTKHMRIRTITARQILDSRGNPTVEVDVVLASGSLGRAAVPSGASAGTHEALELRDKQHAYGGLGVTKAINNIRNIIAPRLIGKLADDQFTIDDTLQHLDGTANKSHLGANATLAVSLAAAKAAATEQGVPLYRHIADLVHNNAFCLPMPMFNIINGGKHAKGSTDFQEFMIVPVGMQDFAKALQAGSEVFHKLGEILTTQKLPTTVGDEGGYAPTLSGNSQALQLITEAISQAGYKPGHDIGIALDVAASELGHDGMYRVDGQQLTSDALIEQYTQLCQRFPIISIEDGLGEDDWDNWPRLTTAIERYALSVGDDLLVTNPRYLHKAIRTKAANTILIKPNQIGTLSETIQTVQDAQSAGWHSILSHRSGETEDTSIAHICVGLGVHYIKSGSLSRSERLAKYNELLRIGESLPTSHAICKL